MHITHPGYVLVLGVEDGLIGGAFTRARGRENRGGGARGGPLQDGQEGPVQIPFQHQGVLDVEIVVRTAVLVLVPFRSQVRFAIEVVVQETAPFGSVPQWVFQKFCSGGSSRGKIPEGLQR